MKDWKNLYPLNTFSGEQKKELETLISSLLEEKEKEVLKEVLNIEVEKAHTYGSENSDVYRAYDAGQELVINKIKSLIIK